MAHQEIFQFQLNSRMPMECQVGQTNMICPRIFLLDDIAPVLVRKSAIKFFRL